MTTINHLSNGTVEVNGKVHKLPNAITSVKGNPDDMLVLKIKDITYTEAFLLGCSILAERKDSDIDVMKMELESSQKEADLLALKIEDLTGRISAHDEVESAEVKESSESKEFIISEFERLTMAAGFHKKQWSRKHLGAISGLTLDKIADVYKLATPEGSITPDVELVRATVEKFL